MKKNLVSRPNTLSVTHDMDKASRQIQKFLFWEKHPRQKQTDFSEPVYVPFGMPLMY